MTNKWRLPPSEKYELNEHGYCRIPAKDVYRRPSLDRPALLSIILNGAKDPDETE